MNSYFIGIIILLLSGFIAGIFSKNLKTVILSVLSGIGSVFCLIPAFKVLLGKEQLISTFNFNDIFGVVNFVIDPLAAFFIIIIAIMSLISVIYSNGYLKPYLDSKNINSHLIFLPILIASMLLVVTCQNALMFLICWEIMSLSSFFLVIFESNKKDVLKSGIKYLVFMHVSVLFIIAAFALMSIKSGSFDFAVFKSVLENNKSFANLVFIFAFIGFGTKSGFVPFHNWLPDAHPAAPSHVSAMMSGVMIKTGFYGILRGIQLIGIPSKTISFIVIIIAGISALYGILYAVTQHDLKRFLAYSSIENVGVIGLGIGIGMLGMAYHNPTVALVGLAGGLFHILNHSLFKELMFMAAGNVYLKTHTKDIEIMGGLAKSMPTTAILFLIGAIAICGLPPFNGFISEFMIYFGMFKGLSINNFEAVVVMLFAISALAFVGTIAILCFSKVFSIVFLGLARSEKITQIKNDCEKIMLIPMGFLAVLIILIGIFPYKILLKINRIVFSLIPSTSMNIWTGCSEIFITILTVALISSCFIAFVIVLIALKLKFTNSKIELHNTWGCGYNKPNNHMQYTASSYASPLLSMLKPLFKKVFDIEKPKKLFPKSAHFSLHFEDIEEAYVINPLIKIDEWFLSKFETLQSGNIQSYIKYGLIFLLITIIGSLFIG